MAIKIPMIVTTIIMKVMMKYNYIKDVVKGAPSDTQHQKMHKQNSPINCDGMQLTSAQCHMAPISIL